MELLTLSGLLYKKLKSPNYSPGRDGWSIKAVVLHITDSSLQSAINTILNPKARASYHYLVDKQGRIWQFVEEKDCAWHSGNVVRPKWSLYIQGTDPNFYTLGVACEGKRGEKINPRQSAVLLVLLYYLFKKYKIKPSRETLVYHREIRADKTCPDVYLDKKVFLWCLIPLLSTEFLS